ncbi:Cholesterol 7-alpha-monooxygenase, partial [Madurella mycetomatis]
MQIRLGQLHFTAVTNPEQIQTLFRSSKQLSSKPGTIFILKGLLLSPASALVHYVADNSGMAATPRKGSNIAPVDRIHFHQASAVQKFLSGKHLIYLAERYLATLDRNLDAMFDPLLPADGEWAEFPDLFKFLQTHISRAAIETVMGTKILELNPTLVDDFWDFEAKAPKFLRCVPGWLLPTANRARTRLLNTVKDWHSLANQHFDCRKTGPEDPEWEPYFGSKLIRRRQEYSLDTSWMNADARASEDMGLIFALNSNVVPSTFWFMFEAIKDVSLCRRMLDEVQACTSSETGHIDVIKLGTQPLLQSVYAETLRLRVAPGIVRVPEMDDWNLDGYRVKKGHTLIAFSRPAALNEEAWTLAGRKPTRPLEEFQAERFLVEKKTSPHESDGNTRNKAGQARKELELEFSLNGLAGCWLPYGDGQ